MLVLAVLGWRASQLPALMAAQAACDALSQGDLAGAVASSEMLLTANPEGETTRLGLECRLEARQRSGDGAAGAKELGPLFDAPSADGWVPAARIGVPLLHAWADAGDTARAARLATRLALASPDDIVVADEFALRSEAEDPETLLHELSARLDRIPAGHGFPTRELIANARLQRGENARGLAALGETPPTGSPDDKVVRNWWYLRMLGHSANADVNAMIGTRDAMVAAGFSRGHAGAVYALDLSIAELQDPTSSTTDLLDAAVAAESEIPDPDLLRNLYDRNIVDLAVNGQQDRALALFDRVAARIGLNPADRSDLLRTRQADVSAGSSSLLQVTLQITPNPPGLTLHASPPWGADPDAAWESIAVPPDGRVQLAREVGRRPVRWVVRDADDALVASGAAWAGEPPVSVTLREPKGGPPPQLTRRPADGRRRVWVVVLDCFDWGLLNYLRERGDMPVLDHLLATGWHAVLHQEPALTAAAMQDLVYPNRSRRPTLLGLLVDYGVEAQAFSDVGTNPLAALRAFQPSSRDLFDVLGSANLQVGNLLFAYGNVQAGMNAQVTGPRGQTRTLPVATVWRTPTATELASFPGLGDHSVGWAPRAFASLAANFDTFVDVVKKPDLDLLALRTDPTDVLTHGYFSQTSVGGQDDGKAVLFDVYRYADSRIGEIVAAIDDDDVLVVMSDHGIATALDHDGHAVFVMAGAGVPVGRAEGTPALLGTGRVLAQLLGVPSDLPDTGIAPWLESP